LGRDLCFEDLIKSDTRQTREEIDAIRRATELNNLFRLGQVNLFHQGSESEIPKNGSYLRGICRCRPNENIQIAGITRPSVISQTVRADDDVFNAAGI